MQDEEAQRLREELARLQTEHEALRSACLKTTNQHNALQLHVKNLEEQLSQAVEHVRHAQADLGTQQADQGELDRLRVESVALHEKATHALELEEEVQRLQRIFEQQQHEFDTTVSLNAQLQEQLDQLSAEQTQLRREDANRIDQKLASLRAALSAQRLENDERIHQLVQERDLARSERDRLQQEFDQLGDGFRNAQAEIDALAAGLSELAVEDARLEEERLAVAQLRNELRSLIDEREQTVSERAADMAELREELEFERSAAQARWDRERDEGVAEFQKLARQLVRVRSERDDLYRTLQEVHHEFERLKQRRLDEMETQKSHATELKSLQDEVEQLRHEAESANNDLRQVREQLEATQRAHAQLLTEQTERESELRRAAESDHEEFTRLTIQLNDAARDRVASERRIAELIQRVDQLSAVEPHVRTNLLEPPELPPRPSLGPDESQEEFLAALADWEKRIQQRRERSTAELARLDRELESARDQLQLLHRDLALGDWDHNHGTGKSITFPFDQ